MTSARGHVYHLAFAKWYQCRDMALVYTIPSKQKSLHLIYPSFLYPRPMTSRGSPCDFVISPTEFFPPKRIF